MVIGFGSATCHTDNGATREAWRKSFKRLPPDFVTGPFAYAPPGLPGDVRLHRIAEIIKFGLPETDMPGHEYLSDDEVAAMAEQMLRLAETNYVAQLANRT